MSKSWHLFGAILMRYQMEQPSSKVCLAKDLCRWGHVYGVSVGRFVYQELLAEQVVGEFCCYFWTSPVHVSVMWNCAFWIFSFYSEANSSGHNVALAPLYDCSSHANCAEQYRAIFCGKFCTVGLCVYFMIFMRESRMLRASLPSSGRPSVCPSVRHTRELYQNGAS